MIRNTFLINDYKDKIAIIENDRAITYREIAQKSFAVHSIFHGLSDTRIAIFLPAGADYIFSLFGIISAGLTAFPINITSTELELSSVLSQADISFIITNNEYRHLISGIPDNKIILADNIEPDNAKPELCVISPDAPMLLLSTSGTTGKAKLVMLSEKNLECSVFGYLDRVDFTSYHDDEVRYIEGVPLTSAYGLFILFAILYSGFTLVNSHSIFTIDGLFRTIEKHKVTHYEGGTAIFSLLEYAIGKELPYDISSLRHIAYGGSGASAEQLTKISNAYPWIELQTGYGMTETSPMITKTKFNMPPDKFSTVGMAMDCADIVVKYNGELTKEPNTKGEILVRGDNVMLGYYNDDDATSAIIHDGYLHTGDVGYCDTDGYWYICGRVKNIILVRGFTVYAEDIENCLKSCDLVNDCLVFGEPDDVSGERICADIVPANACVTVDDIVSWCSAKLSSYKLPSRVRFVDNIKKTSTGKPERSQS